MRSEGQSNELKYTGRMFSLMNTTELKITTNIRDNYVCYTETKVVIV